MVVDDGARVSPLHRGTVFVSRCSESTKAVLERSVAQNRLETFLLAIRDNGRSDIPAVNREFVISRIFYFFPASKNKSATL
jgi:hypothetical protein